MTEGGDATVVVLYRAVGLNEAGDIEAFRGLRTIAGIGIQGGKWFASTHAQAVRWGRAMQMTRGAAARPFRGAEVTVPASLEDAFRRWPRLDGIGPTYFAERDRLAEINAVGRIRVLPETYRPGDEA